MARYAVGGRSAATAATADTVAASLWNPHASVRLRVFEIWICKTVATIDNHGIRRTTTRGTAGSTVTPVIANNFQRSVAPVSGALLDLALFSAQPTLDGVNIGRWNLPAAIGAGVIWTFPEPVEVGPGAGLAIVTPPAVILQPSDITYVWEE